VLQLKHTIQRSDLRSQYRAPWPISVSAPDLP
jgi:hypothetical protein